MEVLEQPSVWYLAPFVEVQFLPRQLHLFLHLRIIPILPHHSRPDTFVSGQVSPRVTDRRAAHEGTCVPDEGENVQSELGRKRTKEVTFKARSKGARNERQFGGRACREDGEEEGLAGGGGVQGGESR